MTTVQCWDLDSDGCGIAKACVQMQLHGHPAGSFFAGCRKVTPSHGLIRYPDTQTDAQQRAISR